MKNKILKFVPALLVGLMGGIIGYSVATQNIIMAFFAILIGIFVNMLIKRKSGYVLEDERVIRVSEKASRLTLNIILIGGALITLFSLLFKIYLYVGYAVGIITSISLTLYLISYMWYNTQNIE